MIERIKTRASDFEQCGEIASVLIKEKRAKRFSTLDLKNNSEQCAGFFRVSYKRKTARPFFTSRLIRADSEQCGGFFRVSYKRKTRQAFFNSRLKK